MVRVTVSATITDIAGCTGNAKTVAYVVTDEYSQVQPSGGVTLGAGGSYPSIVPLRASRLGKDLDRRQYRIIGDASHNRGNAG